MADYQLMGEAIRAALDRTQHLIKGRRGANS